MGQLLSSKIVVEEEAPRIRQIASFSTAVAGALGVAEKGPIGVPTLCTSYEDFVRVFGGYVAGSDLAAAVAGFFENGGQTLYVVRTVHYADVTSPGSKTSAAASKTVQTSSLSATSGSVTSANNQNFDLEPGQTLVVSVDGGGTATATFSATAASRTSGATGPFALVNNQTLTVAIDGGVVQTVTFQTAQFANIGAATAAEVAAVINGQLVGAQATVVANAVKITSDKRGTGSGVNVTGGTANAVLTFTTGNTAGTGNVANIDAVTAAEAVAIINAAVAGQTATVVSGQVKLTSNTSGGSSSVQVTNASTATGFGFSNATNNGQAAGALNTLQVDGKYDGTYGNGLRVKISQASNGSAAYFNWQTLDASGLILETFPNLSMDDADDRYVETIINDSVNGSSRLKATDLDAATTAANQRPADGTYSLTGGNDGLSGIADVDYIGSSAGGTGLRAFDTVDDLTILFVPGIATAAVHNAMISYCEVTRNMQVHAILDPPAGYSAVQINTYVTTTASLKNLSECGSIYWPRIKIVNPNKTVFGNVDQITVPPSGHIAGVYSRTDNARVGGVYDPPAGVERGILFGCVGFETNDVLKEEIRDLVFPNNINPLTTKRGFPRFIDGERNLKTNGNWGQVHQRRGASSIERAIKNGLEFVRHSNNDQDGTLRTVANNSVFLYLKEQMDLGAFASRKAEQAFFSDFGAALNPPSKAKIVTARIGLAMVTAAEFVVLKFSQDTRAIEAEIAAAKQQSA